MAKPREQNRASSTAKKRRRGPPAKLPHTDLQQKVILTTYFQWAVPPQPLTPERDQRFAAELEELHLAYSKGNLVALLEAMFLCDDREKARQVALQPTGCAEAGAAPDVGGPRPPGAWIQVPSWVFETSIICARKVIAAARVQTKGRAGNWVKRWQQDMKDLDRWESVNRLRLAKIGFTNRRAGGDLDTIFDKAAVYITGYAAGTPETIRKSYLRVQKRIKTQPWRYRHFNRVTARLAKGQPQPRGILWYAKRT